MSEANDLATQEGDSGLSPDGGPQDSPDGSSQSVSQLPKEYAPYSKVVPWEEIPEDLRPSVLAGIKKFHGDMSRSASEAVELKKQLQPLQERAQFLERLFQYPEIQEAYRAIQNPSRGQQRQQQQESPRADLNKLADYGLDKEASGVIQSAIQDAIREALAPIADNMRQLQSQVLDREVDHQLAEIDAEVRDQGLPSPREIIPEIEEAISRRKGGIGIKDAYRLATYERLAKATREKIAREAEAAKKQQQSEGLPPKVNGTNRQPGFLDFGPTLSVEQALRMSRAELASRR